MKRGRRLVIDASVARSAGDASVPDLVSGRCRAALEAAAEHHRVAFSDHCLAEWRRHRSRFARGWLTRMFSKRKVVLLGDVADATLRAKVAACALKASHRQAIEKDLHLVEAALLADRTVVSRDQTVREVLRTVVNTVSELRPILWMNPEIEEEDGAGWLARGAKDEPARRLGGSRAPG